MQSSRHKRQVRRVFIGLFVSFQVLGASAHATEVSEQANATTKRSLVMAQAAAPGKAADMRSALDSLLKGAKAEGAVTFYTAVTEAIANRVGAAYTAKYGVKTQFVRLPGAQLQQRFSAEANTGNIAADLLFNAGNTAVFAEAGVKRGWIEPIAEAGLPAIRSGELPRAYNRGVTAVVQISPWSIAYNTEKLKPSDAPKTWADLLKPGLKGQILLPDPRSSDAYFDVWSVLLERYGEGFFQQLRAQNPRQFVSLIPAIQGLGAGEGAVAFPAIRAGVQATKDKGAPLELVTPEDTTGIEVEVILTSRAMAKHPNAARLLANFVLSEEGNKVFNADPGGMTIYDTSRLPKQYQAPQKTIDKARKDQLTRLLGF